MVVAGQERQKGQKGHEGAEDAGEARVGTGAFRSCRERTLISETQFKFVGGDLALDFVNTVSWNAHHEAVASEQFTDYDAVVEWARQIGAVSAAQARRLAAVGHREPAVAAGVLRRVHDMRRALHAVLLDVAAGTIPNAQQLHVLDAEVAKVPLRLGMSPDGGLDWQWDHDRDAVSLERVLWPVVWHAVDLLRSPDGVTRVKSCAADTCGWLFIDESRRGNRKWCDMADCGNRAKVRRYYRRHRKP